MSVEKEIELLAEYCKGFGANIGCGDVQIADSIGIDCCHKAQAAVIVAEATCLPLRDNTLDYIVSAACFEHIDRSPVKVLREWLRCLKVGGIIAIVVPDADYGIWSMTGDTGKPGQLCKPRSEMEHLHAFTKQSLVMLFEFAGMEVIRCEKIDRRPVRPETTILCVGKKTENYVK